jgi:hypothetical protein
MTISKLTRYTATLTRPTEAQPVQYAAGDVISSTASPKSNITVDFSDFSSAYIVGITLKVAMTSVPVDMNAGFTVHFYSAAPAELSDNAAYAITTDTGYLFSIDLATPTDIGGFIFTQEFTKKLPITFGSASTLYANLVTKSAFTPESATVFTLGIVTEKLQ